MKSFISGSIENYSSFPSSLCFAFIWFHTAYIVPNTLHMPPSPGMSGRHNLDFLRRVSCTSQRCMHASSIHTSVAYRRKAGFRANEGILEACSLCLSDRSRNRFQFFRRIEYRNGCCESVGYWPSHCERTVWDYKAWSAIASL